MAVVAVTERNAVEAYLRAVADPPKAYRSVPVEELEARLQAEPSLAGKAILIAKIHEAQEAMTRLEQRRAQHQEAEEAFVKHAGAFSAKHHITYAVWRQMGVPVPVLRRAGIAPVYEGKPPAPEQRKRPYKKRRKVTPEFLAEVLAVYERAGGDMAGCKAVAKKFDYGDGHARALVKQAQEAAWTDDQPPLRIKGSFHAAKEAKDA
jgi:hypothetical protein